MMDGRRGPLEAEAGGPIFEGDGLHLQVGSGLDLGKWAIEHGQHKLKGKAQHTNGTKQQAMGLLLVNNHHLF